MYENFVVSFGEAFRKVADEFIEHGNELSEGDESFRKGYLLGLHRIYTLMEQTADACGLPPSSISIDGLSEGDFLA